MRSIWLMFALLLATVFTSASAATVSLTGSCSYSAISSNSVNVTFSLSNSGDFPATSVSIIPNTFGPLSNIKLNSSNIGSIYPNVTKNVTFEIGGLQYPGEYIFGIIVSYFQGSSNFFASFPCGFNYESKNVTGYISQIYANYSRKAAMVGLFGIGISAPVNVTTYVIAPPQVHYSPSKVASKITPDNETNSTFNISVSNLPGLSNATYSITLASVYYYGGKYLYAIRNIYISSSKPGASVIPTSTLIVIAFTVVIIALIILIAFSVVRKQRRKTAPQ